MVHMIECNLFTINIHTTLLVLNINKVKPFFSVNMGKGRSHGSPADQPGITTARIQIQPSEDAEDTIGKTGGGVVVIDISPEQKEDQPDTTHTSCKDGQMTTIIDNEEDFCKPNEPVIFLLVVISSFLQILLLVMYLFVFLSLFL